MRTLKLFPIGVLAALLLAGCGDSVTGQPLGLSAKSLGSLPSFSGVQTFAAGDVVTDGEVLNLFKLECHMPGQAHHCPAGVEEIPENKYSSNSLLGIIYHAEFKADDVLQGRGSASCDWGGGAGTINASQASFVSADPAGDTSRYMIDAYDRLHCVGRSSGHYYAYSNDGVGGHVVVATRKHDLGTEDWDQSNIWQIHVLTDDAGDAHWLAFNDVGMNVVPPDYYYVGRSVLLVNFKTRRFMIRYGNTIVAAGRGGLTPDGIYDEGYFFVKTSESPDGLCIDNATRLEADAVNCAAEAAVWQSVDEVAAYLELDAARTGELLPYLNYFASGPTAGLFATDEVPQTPDDIIHFPDRVEN